MDLASRIAHVALTHDQGALGGAELLPKRLMCACAELLPVAAAGISIFSGMGHRVPLGASNSSAVIAERLQFTAGEGPCFTAHVQGEMVVADADEMAVRWPIFHHELLLHTDFRKIASVPIGTGPSGGAALDFYFVGADRLPSRSILEELQAAADTVFILLMSTVATEPGIDRGLLQHGPAWLDNQPVQARSLVWIALGMINFGLQLDEHDALARLRSYAYAQSTTFDDIAAQVTTARLPVQALAL